MFKKLKSPRDSRFSTHFWNAHVWNEYYSWMIDCLFESIINSRWTKSSFKVRQTGQQGITASWLKDIDEWLGRDRQKLDTWWRIECIGLCTNLWKTDFWVKVHSALTRSSNQETNGLDGRWHVHQRYHIKYLWHTDQNLRKISLFLFVILKINKFKKFSKLAQLRKR